MRLFSANAIDWVLAGLDIERHQPDITYLSTLLICSVNQVKSQIVEASVGKKVDTFNSLNGWYIKN